MQQLLLVKVVAVVVSVLLFTYAAIAYDCNLEPTDPVNFNNIAWCPNEHCTQVIDPVTGKTYEVKACDDLNKHKAGYCIVSYTASQGLCKCACSCLAYGTPILLANGSTAAVNHIQVGDSVLVANGNKWEPIKVVSSSGTSPHGKEDAALFVSFTIPTEAEPKELISNPSHIYLVADSDGKQHLVRADQLDPTKHSLLDKEFKKVKINSIHVGTWKGGLWHVGTEHPTDAGNVKDMDKAKNHHLLLANGVVVGDWYLQATFSVPLKNDTKIPVLSQSERIAASNAASGDKLRRPVLAGFVSHSASLLDAVPEKAVSLLPRWAQTGKHLAGRLDTLDTVWRREHMQSMMAVYRGIYPDIAFETEWLDDVANIYSWTANGKGFISIHGGILRHKLLHWEGLAFVIARQIAQLTLFDHTYDESDPFSLSCENWADYNAGLVLQNVFGGGPVAFFINMTEPGLKQLEAFFKTFPKVGTLQPTGCGHPRGAIDVECRMRTFKAVFYASPMPSCWGVVTPTTTTTPAPPHHHDAKDEL